MEVNFLALERASIIKLMEAVKKKTGKIVTSAKKEGGGSGQNHDLRFL